MLGSFLLCRFGRHRWTQERYWEAVSQAYTCQPISFQQFLADIFSEVALFSNISAMAVHGAEDKTMKTPKPINKGKLMHVGLRASVYCLSQADKTTVGIVSKSCKLYLPVSSVGHEADDIRPTSIRPLRQAYLEELYQSYHTCQYPIMERSGSSFGWCAHHQVFPWSWEGQEEASG